MDIPLLPKSPEVVEVPVGPEVQMEPVGPEVQMQPVGESSEAAAVATHIWLNCFRCNQPVLVPTSSTEWPQHPRCLELAVQQDREEDCGDLCFAAFIAAIGLGVIATVIIAEKMSN